MRRFVRIAPQRKMLRERLSNLRRFSSADRGPGSIKSSNTNLALYLGGSTLHSGVIICSCTSVPSILSSNGIWGTVQTVKEGEIGKISSGKRGEREIIINFDAGTGIGMPWKFKPLQQAVQLVTGETVLAFYNAENPTDKPMTGVATYNVTPMKAGLYFNKVQCFCFHEQRLQGKENVDMPVFFFIDNEFEEDPRMDDVHEITLSYTFFPIEDDDDEA